MKPAGEQHLANNDGACFFGPETFELLKGVKREGSLAASAKSLRISYSKAMRILHVAEVGMACALTKRTIGGEKGGSSILTPEGNDLLARYAAWIDASDYLRDCMFEACFAGLDDVPRIGCVVMASGVGRRFGTQKLLASLAGKTVLERTLSCLSPRYVDAVVVTRSQEIAALCERLGVECTVHDGALQSDTVRRGLDVMGNRAACMFLPGDQALLSLGSVERLVSEACRNPNHIIRLSWNGKPAGPIIFPSSLYEKLRAIEEDKGGSWILKQYPELQERVFCVEAAHEWELFDVDTQDDIETLERILREERGA